MKARGVWLKFKGLLWAGKDVKARGVWLKFKVVIVGRKGCEGKRCVVNYHIFTRIWVDGEVGKIAMMM